jgi:hypothetical protein
MPVTSKGNEVYAGNCSRKMRYRFSQALCCKWICFVRFVHNRNPLYAVVTENMATKKLPPPWASEPGGNVNPRINTPNDKVCFWTAVYRPAFRSSAGSASANVNTSMFLILTWEGVTFQTLSQLCGTPMKFAPSARPSAHMKQLENHCADVHKLLYWTILRKIIKLFEF